MFKGGMGNLMKQAQQMQENMQKAQAEIAQQQVVGEAGAGMVKVTMNGRHEVLRVEIDDQLIKEEKEFIEDLFAAAINDAVHKIEHQTREKMDGVAADLNLPAGFKLPF